MAQDGPASMNLPKVAVDWEDTPKAAYSVFESRTAQNCAAYLLPALQSLKDANPRVALLDVGAGHGSISATLARLIPEGHVTAVDINPDVIPRAKVIAESYGATNISFQAGDIHKLPFEDNTFDVVHCHQVLAHGKDQVGALREMLRVTKPGGLVASREGDMDSEIWWPQTPGMQKAHDYARMLITAHGGGGCSSSGRQLLSWALEAGPKRSQITPSYSVWHFTEKEDKERWGGGMLNVALAGHVRERAVKAGVKEEDLDEMREAWKEWIERDDATLIMVQGEVLIRK
ncbi:S-adenosyl-L-methionine-dependent methyltransferase [Lasiosphaeria ovina]|uniref:S-adenosyl-L-methionine-dependent methyltransferase n=1 Tax=Lasiosphaeria ovina TaxID=92902 RepID=A0AAE0N518_9PEZI|nr:S-adenosyl-L-methionine-dependent methyltransferase [Lasiosphaeria ovina]